MLLSFVAELMPLTTVINHDGSERAEFDTLEGSGVLWPEEFLVPPSASSTPTPSYTGTPPASPAGPAGQANPPANQANPPASPANPPANQANPSASGVSQPTTQGPTTPAAQLSEMDVLEAEVRSLLKNRTATLQLASAIEVIDLLETIFLSSRASPFDYPLILLDTAGTHSLSASIQYWATGFHIFRKFYRLIAFSLVHTPRYASASK